MRVMLQSAVDSAMTMIGIGVKIFGLSRDGLRADGDVWETVWSANLEAGGTKI